MKRQNSIVLTLSLTAFMFMLVAEHRNFWELQSVMASNINDSYLIQKSLNPETNCQDPINGCSKNP